MMALKKYTAISVQVVRMQRCQRNFRGKQTGRIGKPVSFSDSYLQAFFIDDTISNFVERCWKLVAPSVRKVFDRRKSERIVSLT